MSTIINFSELVKVSSSLGFEGYKFDDTNITFIIVDAAYGEGPKLHSHPYAEVFIVQEGTGLYTIDDKTIEVTGNQVLIVPSNTPHKFINLDKKPLRQVGIHLSPKFITTWLEN